MIQYHREIIYNILCDPIMLGCDIVWYRKFDILRDMMQSCNDMIPYETVNMLSFMLSHNDNTIWSS